MSTDNELPLKLPSTSFYSEQDSIHRNRMKQFL